MRIVLDTNVLVSALISGKGSPGRLLAIVKRKNFTLVTSTYQIQSSRPARRLRGYKRGQNKRARRLRRYDEWKPIYSALVTDIMDQLGYRDQAMTSDIRPSRADAFIAGPALTIDAYADTDPHPDPYGQIFAAYDVVRDELAAGQSPRAVFDRYGIL